MLNKNSFFYRMCYFSTALPFFLKKFCVANSIYNMRDTHYTIFCHSKKQLIIVF